MAGLRSPRRGVSRVGRFRTDAHRRRVRSRLAFKRFAWAHGCATEAARERIEQIFADGARRGFARTMAINTCSQAVMERLGLRLCRTFHPEIVDPL